jgi:acyl-CoA dehydrogenase
MWEFETDPEYQADLDWADQFVRDEVEKYLQPLLDGEIFSCFSMTEPQGGSDPKEFTCSAVLDGDEWVINGEKWFSSNARYASFLIVM